jgi:hypothetical protein
MNISTETHKIYDEIIDLIAQGTTPESVIGFRLSTTTQQHLEDLIDKSKSNEITAEEKRELESYIVLEHIMTLAKAKAYQYLNPKER